MRDSSPKYTPCEMFRDINDLCQGDNDRDAEIREMCAAGEKMTKRLARELHKYSKDIWKDERWWRPNLKYRRKIKERIKPKYKWSKGKKYL